MRGGNPPSSPSEQTSSRGETCPFRQRNPLQRVGVHKAARNVLTPLKVVSNPPQGPSPPFHNIPERQEAPVLGPDS